MRRLCLFIALVSFGLSSAGVARAGNPADLFPDDCLLFIGSPGLKASESDIASTPFGKLLAEPRMVRLCEKIDEAVQKVTAMAMGEGPAELGHALSVIEKLVEAPLGIGVMEFDPLAQSVQAALVIEAGAEGAAELLELMDGLAGAMGRNADEDTVNVSGYQLHRVAIPDAPFELVYAAVGDRFIAGLGVESMTRILVRLDGKGAKPLSKSAAFAAARRRVLPGNSEGYSSIVINVPRVLSIVERVALEQGDGPEVEAISRFFSESGIKRLGPWCFLSGIANQAFQSGCYMPIDNFSPSTTRVTDAELMMVPRDTLFFSSNECDLLEMFEWVRDTAFAVAPDQQPRLEQQLGSVEAFLGSSIEEFCRGFGKRMLIFEDPAMRGVIPGVVIAIKPTDPAPIRRVLASLTAMAGLAAGTQDASVRLATTDVGEHRIQYVDIRGVPAPVAPAWVEFNGYMLFAAHPANLEETILRVEAGGASILENPDFITRRQVVPVQACGLSYFDSPRILGYAYPTLLSVAQAAIGMGNHLGIHVDASYLPPPRFFAKYMSPDIWFSVREKGGAWSVSNASTPISSAMMIAAGAGFAAGSLGPWVVLGSADVAPLEVMPHAAETRPIEPTPAETLRAVRQLTILSQVYADRHDKTFPISVDQLYDYHEEHVSDSVAGAFPPRDRAVLRFGMRPSKTLTTAAAGTVLVWQIMPDPDGKVAVGFVTGECRRMPLDDLLQSLRAQRQ